MNERNALKRIPPSATTKSAESSRAVIEGPLCRDLATITLSRLRPLFALAARLAAVSLRRCKSLSALS